MHLLVIASSLSDALLLSHALDLLFMPVTFLHSMLHTLISVPAVKWRFLWVFVSSECQMNNFLPIYPLTKLFTDSAKSPISDQ